MLGISRCTHLEQWINKVQNYMRTKETAGMVNVACIHSNSIGKAAATKLMELNKGIVDIVSPDDEFHHDIEQTT